ncbi:hypothetical protein HIM_00738 [Hirsutella minnesotensis 3608]|nr:hypothetical protein HIM_00738 [Hirsutella minnesotensis 3608]
MLLLIIGVLAAMGHGASVAIDRVPVDPGVYQKIVDHAAFPRYSAALANGMCTPSNGAQLLKYVENWWTDTQAALWKMEGTKEIVLGIPGTNSLHDWATDASAFTIPYIKFGVSCPDNCWVHAGFTTVWDSIEPAVKMALESALKDNPDYTITISGHSLGGALSVLAYASLKNGPYNVTQLYTYGQPRVGNSAFAKYIESLAGASDTNPGDFYRVTHADDLVPQLPPRLLGYSHSRTEYWESTDAADEGSTYRCSGEEPKDCNLSMLGLGTNNAHNTYAGFDVTCI